MNESIATTSFSDMTDLRHPINVQEFCRSRIDEILMLTEAMNESPFRGQAFQRLPKHMRRRQMSHHVKRMPKRLRNTSTVPSQDDGPGLPKRPSRKFRRRPGNLLLDYNRREKKNVWLETHIWHAKRFHMTTRWGYTLPEKPTNKSFRACYRAVAYHCSIFDISYYGVIELHGPENVLLAGLQQCVSSDTGLTFAAEMCKNGSREGCVTMYHPNSYPYDAVGEVSFLWKPKELENENRKIWINAHPVIYNEITTLFKNLFGLSAVEVVERALNDGVSLEKISPDERENQIPEFINKNRSVTMKLLKNKLNRFRLVGPLSLAVISKAFEAINFHSLENISLAESVSGKSDQNYSVQYPQSNFFEESSGEYENAKRMKIDGSNNSNINRESNSSKDWFSAYYKNEFRKNCLENQANFYNGLGIYQNPSDLSPGMVFSLVVKDPRMTIPQKRMKCTPDNKDLNRTYLTTVNQSLCYSALWETDVIKQVSSKISTAEINKARSKLLVPGSDVGKVLEVEKQAKVPLIIIQLPSLNNIKATGRQDFGSGFDIITPPGWGMHVWLSLIFRGARPGGLREIECLTLDARNISQYTQPDSSNGKLENLDRHQKLKNFYFKLPPSNRPNYAKLGVQSPFYYPWEALLKDWQKFSSSCQSENHPKFFVLRDLKKLSELNEFLQIAVNRSNNKSHCIDSFQLNDMNCLVPISVESCGKGAPKWNTMLCLPTSEDLKEYKLKKVSPTEDQHFDTNSKTRKLLKYNHKKELKSLKRKRKNCKLNETEEQQSSSEKVKELESFASNDIINKYSKEMESLWFTEPQNIDTIMNFCSRPILGFTVFGGFSFSQGGGLGLGYVTLNGLLALLKTSIEEDSPPYVLFRNNDVLKYRFAKIEICINSKY